MGAINETGTPKAGEVFCLERAALRRALALLGSPPMGVVLWNGKVI